MANERISYMRIFITLFGIDFSRIRSYRRLNFIQDTVNESIQHNKLSYLF